EHKLLLYLGLNVGHKTSVLAGTLPKPIIWAQPSSMTALHKPVTIWCQGSWNATEYHLHKEGSVNPWDRQLPLERENKTKFYIQYMSEDYAGLYKCYYKSNLGLSEHSDTLELVLTGGYDKPSLSVWPSPVLTLGESVTMQCSSSLGFGRFILIQEGKKNLSWTLDSQTNGSRKFQAHFVLDSVTINHNVSESKEQSTPENEQVLRYQKVLIGVLVTLLLLFFLLLFLILFRYSCRGKPKKADASVKETQPKESVKLDSWNPPDEDAERIVYAQVKPSRFYKAATCKESQDVTYAQLCNRQNNETT
ncbi:leukocyte immunoglobulin-like receptor subfamily B member 4, partial [Sigmodon hispidus]